MLSTCIFGARKDTLIQVHLIDSEICRFDMVIVNLFQSGSLPKILCSSVLRFRQMSVVNLRNYSQLPQSRPCSRQATGTLNSTKSKESNSLPCWRGWSSSQDNVLLGPLATTAGESAYALTGASSAPKNQSPPQARFRSRWWPFSRTHSAHDRVSTLAQAAAFSA